jgi:hypothetical protein
MKTIKSIMLVGLLSLAFGIVAKAQETRMDARKDDREGWNQGRAGIFSIGMGGTQPIAISGGNAYLLRPGLSTNISAEFRVHRFIGFGFQTGVNAIFEPTKVIYYPDGPVVVDRQTIIGIPFALKTNVHILEAAGNRHSDYLDVYAGFNVGGGPAFGTHPRGPVFGFLQVGPQAGVRYWASRHVAIFGEVGWGATFANAGLTF